MVARGHDTDMSPEEERRARSETLEGVVKASVATGLEEPRVDVERLREIIGRRWIAFRRGLRMGDPTRPRVRVEPLRVTVKPGARPVKARPRVYNPLKTTWLAVRKPSLAALGLVFLTVQAVWAIGRWLRRKGRFRIVSDFRAANKQVEKVPGAMPSRPSIVRPTFTAALTSTKLLAIPRRNRLINLTRVWHVAAYVQSGCPSVL